MNLRQRIDVYYKRKTGKRLNLSAPRGFNEKIQWLKLYDQMPEHVTCCDKLAVRDYVARFISRKYLLEVYQVERHPENLRQRLPSMVKANHDSGSVGRAVDEISWRRACGKVSVGLGRTFGVRAGEWAYARVEPRCFTERLLPDPIIDYKFHCCSGEVRWVQLIAERSSGQPLEVITDRDGLRLPLHLDHEFRHGIDQPTIPTTWAEMLEVAESLSRPFRYVRVDLYSSENHVYFGELTFWPKAGIYATRDEPTFGEMLDMDLSFKRPRLAC